MSESIDSQTIPTIIIPQSQDTTPASASLAQVNQNGNPYTPLAQRESSYQDDLSNALLPRLKDFAKGVLRGNTTDLLNLVQNIANKNPWEVIKNHAIESAKSDMSGGNKAYIPGQTSADTDHPLERPVGDLVLEKITGLQAGDSNQENLGSLFSVGGLAKKVVATLGTATAGTTAKAMIIAAARSSQAGKIQDAEKMLSEGASVSETFNQTGIYKDADQIPKSILSDQNAVVGSLKSEEYKKLPEYLDHPELYKAYPELKDVYVVGRKNMELGQAKYSAGSVPIISIPGDVTTYGLPRVAQEVKDVILHEVQHGVQSIEGFTSGANPTQFIPKNLKAKVFKVQEAINAGRKSLDTSVQDAAVRYKDKYNEKLKVINDNANTQYSNKAGEQEARFTESTSNMSKEELGSRVLTLLKNNLSPQTWDTISSVIKK